MRVHLGCYGREKTAAGEDPGFDMSKKALRELPEPIEPGGGGRRGLDHLLPEEDARRLDRRELELLLGAEMGEEAALAHADRLGQAADREPADALDGGELCSLAENRVPAALAVAPPPARGARSSSADLRLAHG